MTVEPASWDDPDVQRLTADQQTEVRARYDGKGEPGTPPSAADISLVLDGRPQVTREAALDGIPIRISVIDINAIGAGGGSIAWIDEGGALRVGPEIGCLGPVSGTGPGLGPTMIVIVVVPGQ